MAMTPHATETSGARPDGPMGGAERGTQAAPEGPRQILLIANGNPLSRDAADTAQGLRGRIESAVPAPVELITTEFAGHAEQVAQHWAEEHGDGLIIAVGGDGTLNQVANGVMTANASVGARTAVAVYPAGNANDHFRSWHFSAAAIVDLVRTGATANVDLLELAYASRSTGEHGRRYALSYVAVGFLASAAAILHERKRNSLTNLAIVPLTLRRSRPVRVTLAGREVTLDSLSWHVVPTMAKYLTVSSNARRDDGLMEIIVVPHRRGLRWLRIPWLAARAAIGLRKQEQRASMAFHWESGGDLQLDGEPLHVPLGSEVSITCIRGAITMLCGP